MSKTPDSPNLDGAAAPSSTSEPGGSGIWSFRRRQRSKSSLFAAGEPMVWLTGGSLVVGLFMVFGLLALVLVKGLGTFWPTELERVETHSGQVFAGEVTREEFFRPTPEQLAVFVGPAQVAASAELEAREGLLRRRLFRTGNYKLTQNHFSWVADHDVAKHLRPDWLCLLERREWGIGIGTPEAFILALPLEIKNADGSLKPLSELESGARADLDKLGQGARVLYLERRFESGAELEIPVETATDPAAVVRVAAVLEGPEAAWRGLNISLDPVTERFSRRRDLEKHEIGAVNAVQETARLEMRQAELDLEAARRQGRKVAAGEAALAAARATYEQKTTWADAEFARIRTEIDAINSENSRYRLLLKTPGAGSIPAQATIERLDQIVRAYPANRLSFFDKLGIYLGRWVEFIADEPREANSEGGVFPAIFGTVAMTLIMSILVVPFGVLAALYLREYAKAGPLVSAVRIAVNNLAGVPSIVFGVFGLGFFCYAVGASIDDLFFAASLPNPTYGTGGLLWASLTLALLTLPVVIVATEEAVAAVPSSMREGSYACGASKWQTIQRIVLPRALPGIITGMILAIARGAGEVAPLMLVGAVKLAPELPVDGIWPFVHPERSFMHLGFHIYDVGFQSQNSEAAKPMVFTTTLLLIAIIALLNVAAIQLRSRLRKKYAAGQF